MNFEIFTRIILVVINAFGLVLAWWVLRSDSKKNLKFWYFLMTTFMLSWANLSFFGSRSHSIIQSNILYRLNWASVALFLASFYFFYVVTFLEKGKMSRFIGILIFLFSSLWVYIILFTNLVIETSIERNWGMEIIFGPLGDYFNLFSLAVAVLVIGYSIQGFGKLDTDTKKKLKVFLSGVVLFILANVVFNVGSQVLFKSVQYQILGDFSSIFLLGFTAYASIQHKLFDVEIIATEAVTAILVVVMLSRIFVAQDQTELIVDLVIFCITVLFGYLLIKSVSAEVQQRKQLQKLTKRLKELDAQKDEFLNVAAHELRAPMTAIKGYLSMISDGDAGKISTKVASYLEEATNENDRLVRLVNNLLNISRIEEGRLTYEMGKVSLSKVVQTDFNSFQAQAQEKGLNITLNIQKNIHDSVYVDKDRIYEVVNNLISNAIKYTDQGGVQVILKNTDSNKIRFEVIDTGEGLTEEEKQNLFKKFYRAESSINKQIGTGLGLYISKLLINHFGGTIGLESEKGKGSTFWFELPLQK